MVGRRRLDGPAELAVDIAHPLVGPAVLEPYLRLLGDLPCEALVVTQGLLEKLFLKRVETVFQPVFGHLGVHVIDGPAGLQALDLGLVPLDLSFVPLGLRLIPLARDQSGADREGSRCGHEQAQRSRNGGAMLPGPPSRAARQWLWIGR